MPGGRCGLYPSLEKQREEMARKRSEERAKPCPMRHPENGNCLPHGGFCLNAVSDSACEAMHKAYEMGYTAGAARAESEAEQPLTLEELQQMDGRSVWLVISERYQKLKHWDGWSTVIVDRDLERFGVIFIHMFKPRYGTLVYHNEDYGKDWTAYRRPPVEVQHDDDD